MPDITVAICTRNPRKDYLARTLAGLSAQTLPAERWEFLLVDNGSEPPLTHELARLAHPEGRVIPESITGLTPARLAAVRAARGETIVFVDDDNVLAPDYLAQALAIAVERPELGCWGGHIEAEFETPAPDWLGNWRYWLAIRAVKAPLWSNIPFDAEVLPYGAGMCIRREIAEVYARNIADSSHRRGLDRTGDSLVGGGDADMAYTAYDLGLGNGLFPQLRLLHLIGSRRLEVGYLERLVDAMSFSYVVLHALRGRIPPRPRLIETLLKRYQLRRIGGAQRTLELARYRGQKRGHAWVRAHL